MTTDVQCSLVQPEPPISLPICWNQKDKHQFLELHEGRLRVSYIGEGKSNNDAATVRADCPVPPSCGIFYYEVSIVNKGKEGFIGIGACTSTVSLSKLPGWERNSFGYHGDDGKVFRESGTGTPFGPGFSTGDVVGCGISYVRNEMFFTKNGVLLGSPFKNLGKRPLFPCIGLRTPGEDILANFGQKPFRFDIQTYFEDEREWVKSEMLKTQVPGKTDPAPHLVLSYLVHCGFSETTDAFLKSFSEENSSSTVSAEDMVERRDIFRLVMNGKIAEAEEMCRKNYTGMLESDENGVIFDLNCQRFIEIVRSGDIPEAVAFGSAELSRYTIATNDKVQKVLQNVFALLAYKNPAECPVSFLLEQDNRIAVAERLNSAILEWKGQPPISPLEVIVRQLSVCLNGLRSMDVARSVCFDVQDYVGGDY